MERALKFILETVGHGVRRDDGPPPSIPAGADREFETSLVSLASYHGVAGFVARAFAELSLPPGMSRFSVTRLQHHIAETDRRTQARFRLAAELSEAFTRARIRHQFLGDVWSAAQLHSNGELRPIGSIDILIPEWEIGSALELLDRGRFFSLFNHPWWMALPGFSSEAHAERVRAARDVARFHHCVAPLVLRNARGDTVRLRTRAVDAGYPPLEELSWRAENRLQLPSGTVPGVSVTVQLEDAVVGFVGSRYEALLRAVDAAHLLTRWSDRVDAEFLRDDLTNRGAGDVFDLGQQAIVDMFRLRPQTFGRLPMSPFTRLLLQLAWRRDPRAPLRRADQAPSRWLFGAAGFQGGHRRLKTLARRWLPPERWLKSMYGTDDRSRNWWKFVRGADRPRPTPRHVERMANPYHVERYDV